MVSWIPHKNMNVNTSGYQLQSIFSKGQSVKLSNGKTL